MKLVAEIVGVEPARRGERLRLRPPEEEQVGRRRGGRERGRGARAETAAEDDHRRPRPFRERESGLGAAKAVRAGRERRAGEQGKHSANAASSTRREVPGQPARRREVIVARPRPRRGRRERRAAPGVRSPERRGGARSGAPATGKAARLASQRTPALIGRPPVQIEPPGAPRRARPAPGGSRPEDDDVLRLGLVLRVKAPHWAAGRTRRPGEQRDGGAVERRLAQPASRGSATTITRGPAREPGRAPRSGTGSPRRRESERSNGVAGPPEDLSAGGSRTADHPVRDGAREQDRERPGETAAPHAAGGPVAASRRSVARFSRSKSRASSFGVSRNLGIAREPRVPRGCGSPLADRPLPDVLVTVDAEPRGRLESFTWIAASRREPDRRARRRAIVSVPARGARRGRNRRRARGTCRGRLRPSAGPGRLPGCPGDARRRGRPRFPGPPRSRAAPARASPPSARALRRATPRCARSRRTRPRRRASRGGGRAPGCRAARQRSISSTSAGDRLPAQLLRRGGEVDQVGGVRGDVRERRRARRAPELTRLGVVDRPCRPSGCCS